MKMKSYFSNLEVLMLKYLWDIVNVHLYEH